MTTSYRRFKNEEALPCSAIADHQSTLVIRKICRQGGDLSQARNSRFAFRAFSTTLVDSFPRAACPCLILNIRQDQESNKSSGASLYGKLRQVEVALSFTDVVFVKNDWMLKSKSLNYFLDQ